MGTAGTGLSPPAGSDGAADALGEADGDEVPLSAGDAEGLEDGDADALADGLTEGEAVSFPELRHPDRASASTSATDSRIEFFLNALELNKAHTTFSG